MDHGAEAPPEALLPEHDGIGRNRALYDELPEAVRDEMTFHVVDDVAKVLDLALEPVGQDEQVDHVESAQVAAA